MATGDRGLELGSKDRGLEAGLQDLGPAFEELGLTSMDLGRSIGDSGARVRYLKIVIEDLG